MAKRVARRAVRDVMCASFLIASTLSAATAHADTIWVDWTAGTVGTPGTATGTIGSVGVSYLGELDALINGISGVWAPDSSFVGGTVTASPIVVRDHLLLNGSFTGINTVTFASPVIDPVFALWSLGQTGVAASFTFNATPTFQAGGPNILNGGGPIVVAGNVVSGNEGNGVVQFTGAFTSISWTNTSDSSFYAFTVGANGPLPIPEPATFVLLGGGIFGVAVRQLRNRRRR